MKREHLVISLFFLIAAATFYLFYRLIAPFFVPLAWAAVFAILFYPPYEKLLIRVKRPGIAALIIDLVILVLIIGPVTYLFLALVDQASNAVIRVNQLYASGDLQRLLHVNIPWLSDLLEKLSAYVDLSRLDVNELAKNSVDKIGGLIVGQTTWLITNATKAVLYFLMMLFATYYFLKDGPVLVERLRRLMPLSAEQTDTAFVHLRDVIYATMYSGLLVALLQGLLGGLLFWIVGIPSALFWGAIMAFLSILPFIGAFIVYIPAGLILILGGSWIKGLIVLIFGTIVVSQVDNLLRPYLVAGRTAMHPMMLFFSMAGGVAIFGLVGLIIGPLVAALFVTLLDIVALRLQADSE
ncbi:MAG: AI-2E family transporter [Candidatus Zixiibacteriota bacterium]